MKSFPTRQGRSRQGTTFQTALTWSLLILFLHCSLVYRIISLKEPGGRRLGRSHQMEAENSKPAPAGSWERSASAADRKRSAAEIRRSSGPPCRTRDRTGHPAGGEPRSEGTRQKKKPEGARRLHRPDSIPNPLDKKRNCVSGLAEGDPSSVSCLKK